MLRSLTSAVSGLQNFTIMLDVLGNNLANVRTLGFKANRVTFAEAMSQGLSGQKQIGLGVNLNATDLDFTQGSMEFTGSLTDMGISGKSFFILSDGDKSQYSRAGNFTFNSEGILVNPNGMRVQGWRADAEGEIDNFAPLQNILLDQNMISPSAATENAFLSGNLDSSLIPLANIWASGIPLTLASDGSNATASTSLNDLAQTGTALVSGDTISITGTEPDGTTVSGTFTYATDGTTVGSLLTTIEAAFGSAVTASVVDGKIVITDVAAGDSDTAVSLSSSADIALPSFENTVEGFTGTVSTSTVIYDSLGASHNLVITFTKTEEEGEWTWEAELAGGEGSVLDGDSGTIQFNTAGEVVSFDVDGTATGITLEPGTGASQFTVELDVKGTEVFSGLTQYSSDSTLLVREQDGRPTGDLLRLALTTEGIIRAVFSNDETADVAQIALAEFPNPVGLFRTGDALFELTSSSGTPFIGAAGEQFNSSILSGSLEQSNVDLVRQFTDMITTQRGFQANARVVTTADQILEETMRLKR
ncbi:flagellar hook protein FlgE [Candidatus Neomarinimicrobiota bacterium]